MIRVDRFLKEKSVKKCKGTGFPKENMNDAIRLLPSAQQQANIFFCKKIAPANKREEDSSP